jgi:hypothetical protein
MLETQTLHRFKHLQPPRRLKNWLTNPVEDWNLAIDLMLYVQASLTANKEKENNECVFFGGQVSYSNQCCFLWNKVENLSRRGGGTAKKLNLRNNG